MASLSSSNAGPSSLDRQEYRANGLSEPLGHYSDTVRYKDMLFISGVAGIDEAYKITAPDDIVEQTRKTLDNMRLALKTVGADFCDLLKIVVYVTDIRDMSKINAVRKEKFGQVCPASTLVEVSRLALPNMKIEIDAVARVPDPVAEMVPG